jgi:N-acetylneuraminic acid mutarotase
MSKSVALLFVLFLLTASCVIVAKPALSSADVAENSWTSKAPIPQGKSDFGLVVVNGKIYAIGGQILNYVSSWTRGFSGTRESVNSHYEFNPAADKWISRPTMPTPRHSFATVVYEDNIYCIGGVKNLVSYGSRVTATTTAVEAFNLSTNKWENKTSMPTRRDYFATMVYEDDIYCVSEGKNEVYNIATDTWQTKAPMPFNESWTTANVVNSKLYLTFDSLMYVYDPATDSWTTEAPIQTENYGTVSAVIDDKIYVISANLTQIYDTETNTVRLGAPPPPNFSGGIVLTTTGEMAPKRIYILGETPEVYDPEADSWTIGAKMPIARSHVGFAVVNDKIYAIGGNTVSFSRAVFPDYGDINVRQYATNEEYTPFEYGTVPPKISVISPESQNYNVSSVSLAFTLNRPVIWMGYSLDGQDNVTISENTTIPDLPNGLHNVTVYAKDTFGNVGASETVSLTVEVPFPTALVVAPVAMVVVVGAVLAIYFKKRRAKSGDEG